MKQKNVVRFENVSFRYGEEKIILDKVNFNIREYSKVTIMGQNGAGKSTIFKLLLGELAPVEGKIHIDNDFKIGIARQMIPHNMLDKTIKEYFITAFDSVPPTIDKEISSVLEMVEFSVDPSKRIRELSGGQKARILLAFALIQDPDLLLLDEPTNNLDPAGIEFLTNFLITYWKTCIVISHDADFLNSFTDGVLNLDVHTKKVEQFQGNYFDVLNQIEAHIERQRLQNARIEKSIKERFEKVNKLGGKSVEMRRMANKVRADIERDREEMVEVRRDDKTIPHFIINEQHVPYPLITISEVSFLKQGKVTTKKVDISIKRGETLLISGPNGIGKSTLLKSFMQGKGAKLGDKVKVGYYSQDFSELDFNKTAFDSLVEVVDEIDKEKIYGAAGRFLLSGNILNNPVGSLSEGQKGLLCYARFMLQEPGLLIMDEPTNHINFRHLPVIAKAITEYKGGLILISHLPDFVKQVNVTQELDLSRL